MPRPKRQRGTPLTYAPPTKRGNTKTGQHPTIPWDTLTPLIRRWRDAGTPLIRIADSLSRRFGCTITPNAIQRQLDQATDNGGVQPYRILTLPKRGARITDEQVRAALQHANTTLGKPLNSPVPVAVYSQVRRDSRGTPAYDTLPSSNGIIRRYGTWGQACTAAGITTNPPRRSFDGLGHDDLVVWLAHWLRDLRHQPGTPDATAYSYRLWVQDHPDAPTYETTRRIAAWGDLVRAAADLEQRQQQLPRPKPVSEGPGKLGAAPHPVP